MTEDADCIGTVRMMGVTGDSWISNKNVHSITDVFRKYFGMADRSITITAYSITYNKDLLDVLEKTLERGVSISIIANDFGSEHHMLETLGKLAERFPRQFVVKSFSERLRGSLHAKIVSIDFTTAKPMAIVGSANFTDRALTRNHEVVVALEGKAAETLGELVNEISKEATLVPLDAED